MTKKSKSKIPVSNFYNIYLPCQIYSGIPVRQSQSKSFISAFCNYFACLHRFPKVSDVYIITRCNWTVWEKQATCVPQLHHKSSAGLCNKHCLKIHTHTYLYTCIILQTIVLHQYTSCSPLSFLTIRRQEIVRSRSWTAIDLIWKVLELTNIFINSAKT